MSEMYVPGYAFSPDGNLLVADIDGSGGKDILIARDLSPRVYWRPRAPPAGTKLSPEEWQALVGITPAGIPTCS
jgi:hypothetical protein